MNIVSVMRKCKATDPGRRTTGKPFSLRMYDMSRSDVSRNTVQATAPGPTLGKAFGRWKGDHLSLSLPVELAWTRSQKTTFLPQVGALLKWRRRCPMKRCCIHAALCIVGGNSLSWLSAVRILWRHFGGISKRSLIKPVMNQPQQCSIALVLWLATSAVFEPFYKLRRKLTMAWNLKSTVVVSDQAKRVALQSFSIVSHHYADSEISYRSGFGPADA